MEFSFSYCSHIKLKYTLLIQLLKCAFLKRFSPLIWMSLTLNVKTKVFKTIQWWLNRTLNHIKLTGGKKPLLISGNLDGKQKINNLSLWIEAFKRAWGYPSKNKGFSLSLFHTYILDNLTYLTYLSCQNMTIDYESQKNSPSKYLKFILKLKLKAKYSTANYCVVRNY